MKNLTNLNLNNNCFNDFDAIVESISTIPNIQNLNLNLEDNSQVTLILQTFPQLRSLNNQIITQEDLINLRKEKDEESNLKSANNNFKFDNFDHFDNKNNDDNKNKNKISSETEEVNKNTSPNFNFNVNFNDSKRKETQHIQKNSEPFTLTKELILKGSPSLSSKARERSSEKDKAKVKEQEQEKQEKINENISENKHYPHLMNKEKKQDQGSALDQYHSKVISNSGNDVNINQIIQKLQLQTKETYNKIRNESIFRSDPNFQTFDQKYKEMINNAFKNVQEYLSNPLGNPQCHQIFQSAQINFLFNDFAIELLGQTNPKLSSFFQDIKENYILIIDSFDNYLTKSYKDMEQLKTQLQLKSRQSPKSLNKAQEILIKELTELNKELTSKIGELESDNKKYLERIINHSKGKASQFEGKSSNEISNTSDSPTYKFRGNNSKSHGKSKERSKRSTSELISLNQAKSLTLNQLKELIQDIYIQKQKYDEKSFQNQIPKETMEEFLYTYLDRRYGLKSLTIEWAISIINAIKMYSFEDNDVALFGKILRNECDEDFVNIQHQLKTATSDILFDKLRKRFKYKSEAELSKMKADIVNGFIDDELAYSIVVKMYNENHSEIINNKIQEIIKLQKEINEQDHSNQKAGSEATSNLDVKTHKILFQKFLKIVLDFQLKSHEKYISPFLKEFKSIDKDTDGILNKEQFKKLIEKLNICSNDEQVEYLLHSADPFDNDQITFSDCLLLFSSELVSADDDNPESSQTITLLDKFSKTLH